MNEFAPCINCGELDCEYLDDICETCYDKKTIGKPESFLDYIKAERADFTRSMNRNNEKGYITWEGLSPKVRVAIEDILIAYDQMAEALAKQTPPEPC